MRQQLYQEINYVSEVWSYIDAILGVYNEDSSGNITVLNTAVDSVKNSIDSQSKAPLSTKWANVYAIAQTIAGDTASIAGGAPLKLAVDSLFIIGKLGATSSQNSYGVPLQILEYTFDELETQTSDNLTQHLTIIRRLRDLILTDWGRLQTLGTPLTNDTIKWDTGTNTAVQNLLGVAFRREVFGKLIGSVYELRVWDDKDKGEEDSGPYAGHAPTLADLCPDYTQYCGETFARGGCARLVCQTPNSSPENWLTLPISPTGNPPQRGDDGQNYKIMLIARDVRCGAGQDSALLGPLFARLNPDDQTQLGIYKPYFFLQQEASSPNIRVRYNEHCNK